MSFIRWFEEVDLHDAPRVGGKGANLGELTRAGLPVPPGFVITADAYLVSMDGAGVRNELSSPQNLPLNLSTLRAWNVAYRGTMKKLPAAPAIALASVQAALIPEAPSRNLTAYSGTMSRLCTARPSKPAAIRA